MTNISDKKLEDIVSRYPHIWKSKASFMSYLRGGIRRSCWLKHPIKLEFIKNNRERIPNPNPNGNASHVWGGECSICKNLFVQSKLSVDHIREFSASLREVEDIQNFVELISLVTEDDLRWVCKGCHEIVSYSQKMDISFEQARVEKQFIQIKKDKKVLDILREFNVHSIPKLKKDQESLLRELLLENMNDKQTKD